MCRCVADHDTTAQDGVGLRQHERGRGENGRDVEVRARSLERGLARILLADRNLPRPPAEDVACVRDGLDRDSVVLVRTRIDRQRTGAIEATVRRVGNGDTAVGAVVGFNRDGGLDLEHGLDIEVVAVRDEGDTTHGFLARRDIACPAFEHETGLGKGLDGDLVVQARAAVIDVRGGAVPLAVGGIGNRDVTVSAEIGADLQGDRGDKLRAQAEVRRTAQGRSHHHHGIVVLERVQVEVRRHRDGFPLAELPADRGQRRQQHVR